MFLSELSNELLFKILENASLSSLKSISSASKKWHQLTEDEQLWKARIFAELTQYPVLKSNQTYKQYYINIYKQQGYYPSCGYKYYLQSNTKLLSNNQRAKAKNSPLNEATLDGYLIEACRYGAEVWAKELLKKGANLNFKEKYSDSLGVLAIEQGNIELLKLLLNYKLDINFVTKDLGIKNSTLFHAALFSDDPDKYFKIILTDAAKITILSPIHQAIIKRDLECLSKLIKKGADINKKDEVGCSPVWWALMREFREGFKLLLESGAEINNVMKDTYDGELSLLRVIVNQKKSGYMEWVLQTNPHCDVNESWVENFESGDAITLLIRAVQKHLAQEVKLLLFYGASNIQAALQEAAGGGNLEIIKILIEAGANVNSISTCSYNDRKDGMQYGQAPLLSAASLGHAECVEYLLNNKANPNLKIQKFSYHLGKLESAVRGISSLHEAASHIAGIRFKLNVTMVGYGDSWDNKKKAIIHEFNQSDYDPLNSKNLISHNAIATIKWLLQFGADVNAKNTKTESAMSILIKDLLYPDKIFNKNINKLIAAAIAILLQYQANVNLEAQYWDEKLKRYPFKPLLHFAIEKNCLEIVKLLIETGKASIHLKDNFGNTALLAAAKQGNEKMIDYLIDKGANVADQNNEGETLLSIATKNGYQNIIDNFQPQTKSFSK